MMFPLLISIAMVLFVLMMFAWVDHTTDLVDRLKMTRLQSLDIVSSNEVVLWMGLSLFATHSEVNFGTVLNHMPRYPLLAVFSVDLVLISKNPSTYLPFLEMSLSLTASAWPGKMVSTTAQLGGMLRHKSEMNKMRRHMMKLQLSDEHCKFRISVAS